MAPSASNNAQKTVVIRDVMKDPEPEKEPAPKAAAVPATPPVADASSVKAQPVPPPAPKTEPVVAPTPPTPQPKAPIEKNVEPVEDNWDNDDEVLDIPADFDAEGLAPKAEKQEENPLSPEEQRLQTAWFAMLDSIFADDPLVLYPLKQHLPIIENGTLTIPVKNSMQIDRLKQKGEQILKFMQTQYDANIAEVKPLLETNLESQKAIFDNKDKLQHFHEENKEFGDFLSILNLAIKED